MEEKEKTTSSIQIEERKRKKEKSTSIDLKSELHRIELQYMEQAYKTFGNVRDAALSLGMTAPTFVRKRKQYAEENKYQVPNGKAD